MQNRIQAGLSRLVPSQQRFWAAEQGTVAGGCHYKAQRGHNYMLPGGRELLIELQGVPEHQRQPCSEVAAAQEQTLWGAGRAGLWLWSCSGVPEPAVLCPSSS